MDWRGWEHTFTQAYNEAKVTSWLDGGGDIETTGFSKLGHTMLQMAAIENHESLLGELLRRGAKADHKGRGGKTALMHAATFGNRGCVEKLLRAGADATIRADIDDSDFTENDGLTALEIVEADLRTHVRPRLADIAHMLRGAEQTRRGSAPPA